jgi:hypothetical protein
MEESVINVMSERVSLFRKTFPLDGVKVTQEKEIQIENDRYIFHEEVSGKIVFRNSFRIQLTRTE